MDTSLRLLLVEDSEIGALCVLYELHKSGYEITHKRVETMEAMQIALNQQPWDLVLSNYTLPKFSAIDALNLVQAARLDLPFIVVYEFFEEDAAIAMMQAGAHDCLRKGKLKRLAPVVARELREAKIRRQKEQAEAVLRQLAAKRMNHCHSYGELAYEFISVLNHELRTPLTSLQASIELLQTHQLGPLSEQSQRMLDIAARNTDRLVQLTKHMLNPESFVSEYPTRD
jgi:DNA-binding NtrC family response regulator